MTAINATLVKKLRDTTGAFVLDPGQRVERALKEAEQAAGAGITVRTFVRFRTGEGIEKSRPAFAD